MAPSWKKVSTFGVAAAALLLLGANGDGCGGSLPVGEPGTLVRMELGGGSDFYAAPFPSEHRRKADGTIDVAGFPNPGEVDLVDQIVAILGRDADGFGTTSGIFFSLTGALDPASLPDMRGSIEPGASVSLISVDAAAPDFGQRYPIQIAFESDGGPFGATNMLALLPYQGVPLRPGTLYAAVVRRSVRDAAGEPLGTAPAVKELAAGLTPEGMSESSAKDYVVALHLLQTQGVDTSDVAGISVFRTGNPTLGLGRFVDHAIAQPLPEPTQPFEPAEVFDGFCVYQTTIKMPTYQAGVPPYDTEGGGWAVDANGEPAVQAEEEANFVVTLPRAPMPAAGFPVVVFSRTGAGGERPLVDRGVRATPGGPPIEPGTGPAMELAQVGFAGSSIDGPHGGLRNVTKGDEQFLVFNVFNPLSLRDNLRQSALELVLQAHILESIAVDASACPGLTTPDGGPARFDVETMAAFGHSMGASIVPLAVAYEPRLRGAILSGAGSSFIANIVHKKKPIETKGFAELLLEYTAIDRSLTELDPVMSVLQWAAEPADVQADGRALLREPLGGAAHHILMVEGVVDRYIMPPIANATALSLGLDLAGPELDAESEELASFAPLASVLDLGGRNAIAFPAQGNVEHAGGTPSTAVVVQHPEDGVEDGHEAVFQLAEPKHQYRCFLQGLAKGAPLVPAGSPTDAACE
jgi:hypothetical protein